MRKIKFRGRDIKSGEMVYGDYCTPLSCEYPHIRAHKQHKYIEVAPDSVKQLIAVDVNGKEVYEGDPISDTFDWRWDSPEQLGLFEQSAVVLNNKFHHKATFADYEDILEGCAALVDPATQAEAVKFLKSKL